MQGRKVKPISFETPDLFRWTGQDVHEALAKPYEEITEHGVREGVDPDSAAGFLMRTALDAQVSSDLIRKAVRQQPLAQYPGSPLARDLAMVASMIRAGLKTRVYYVSLGGFDTHSGEGGPNGRHSQLLQTLAEALHAFYADLKAGENDKRVLTHGVQRIRPARGAERLGRHRPRHRGPDVPGRPDGPPGPDR
ncbi:MAG: DUF1501 domain-containing protein [Phycisphaerales bacterium]|nr:DUF1501 domain-containing protein [Phycisphaerales bacterium]